MKQTLLLMSLVVVLLCGFSAFAVSPEAPAQPPADEALPAVTVEATLPAAAPVQCAAPALGAAASPAETVFGDSVFVNCDPWGCRALCQAKGFWDGFCILDTCICEQGPY